LLSSNILQFKAAGSYLPFFPLGFLESFSLPWPEFISPHPFLGPLITGQLLVINVFTLVLD
jgi:hypothetical protein